MSTINVVVDLSHFNTVSGFEAVKADGIVGVIHKATQGTSAIDSKYHVRKPEALAAGLWWGAYHFGVGGDGAAQAQHFLSVVTPGPKDLLVLDLEENSGGAGMTLAEAEDSVNRSKRRPNAGRVCTVALTAKSFWGITKRLRSPFACSGFQNTGRRRECRPPGTPGRCGSIRMDRSVPRPTPLQK